MKPNSAKTLDIELLTLLHRSPTGLTLGQLQRSLSIDVSASDVLEALHRLQVGNQVALRRGSVWHSNHREHPPVARTERSTPYATRSTAEGKRTGQELPDRKKSSIDPDVSRWKEFRRLCRYYAECVRLEQGAKVSAYADQENKRYVFVPQDLNWRSLSAGNPIGVSIRPEWRDFLRTIRADTNSTLYLGMPVDLYVGKDQTTGDTFRILSPVFVQPVAVDMSDGIILLRPSGTISVNHGWLEGRFRSPDDRRLFHELCGLARSQTEETEAAQTPDNPTLAELTGVVKNYYADWWQEASPANSGRASLQTSGKAGVYARTVLIAPKAMKYTGRMHRELIRLADVVPDTSLDASALRFLFPHEPLPPVAVGEAPSDAELQEPTSGLLPPAGVAEYELLNDEQRSACRNGLNTDLSVVTGPPGTGKSRVVAHVMANQCLRGRATLFASRNHQAIEAVEPRLNALFEPKHLVIRLSQPYGQTSEDPILRFFTDLFARPRRPHAAGAFNDSLKELAKCIADHSDIRDRIGQTFTTIDEMSLAIRELENHTWNMPAEWAGVVERCPSVPSPETIDRLCTKLGRNIEQDKTWLGRLIQLINRRKVNRVYSEASAVDQHFTELFGTPGPSSTRDEKIVSQLRRWILAAKAVDSARNVHRLRQVQAAAVALPSLYERFSQLGESLRQATRRGLEHAIDAAGQGISGDQRESLAVIWAGVQNHRGKLTSGRSVKFERAIRDSFPALLRHVPLWTTTNLSAGRDLPLTPGAFDLLIIDEASQCDIASVIPLLYRAKRVMAVGDPMQLSHVSTIGSELDWRLRSQMEITDAEFERYTYRVNSFYQLASTSRNTAHSIQLQDHHRSHPSIAGYCNETFYGKTLRINTSTEALRAPDHRGGFRWSHIADDCEAVAGGGAISVRQIGAIIVELQRLAAGQFLGTVGVVSPFRAQATRIRDRLAEVFPAGLPPHWKFHVDTADGFQGDERDVILFSLVGGTQMPSGAEWFLKNSPNRFNVAVSRARAVFHVFADEGWAQTCKIDHIQRLYTAVGADVDSSRAIRSELIGPVWEPKLAEAFRRAEVPFQQQFPACGRYLDFAVLHKGLKLDVEVDGESFHRDHSGRRKIEDLERDLVLIANGWTVLRFWVYELRDNIDRCVGQVLERVMKADGPGTSGVTR